MRDRYNECKHNRLQQQAERLFSLLRYIAPPNSIDVSRCTANRRKICKMGGFLECYALRGDGQTYTVCRMRQISVQCCADRFQPVSHTSHSQEQQSRQSNQHRAAETAIQGSEDDPAKASTRAERTAQRGEEGRLPCDPRSARRRGRQFRPRHARAAWQPSLPAWGGFCGYINLRPGSLLALAEQVDLSRFRMSIPYRSLAGLNQARFSHAFTTKCDRSR